MSDMEPASDLATAEVAIRRSAVSMRKPLH